MKTSHAFAAIVAAISLTACAGIKIEEARKLSNAGVKTSKNFAETTSSVARGLDHHAGRSRFDLQLDAEHPPKVSKHNVLVLEAPIKARRAMANHLASAYAAFFKLAEYDAAGELSKSVDRALSSANDLAGALKLESPITDRTKAIVGELAMLWADYDQADRLHQASRLMRESLEAVQKVFDAEKEAWASPIRQAALDRTLIIRDLMDKGVVTFKDDYLEGYLSLSEQGLRAEKIDAETHNACLAARRQLAGLDFVTGSRPLAKSERARYAAAKKVALTAPCLVIRAERDRFDQATPSAVEQSDEWITATADALTELRALHVAFESGVTIDAANLEALHQRAKDAADRLSKALGGDAA